MKWYFECLSGRRCQQHCDHVCILTSFRSVCFNLHSVVMAKDSVSSTRRGWVEIPKCLRSLRKIRLFFLISIKNIQPLKQMNHQDLSFGGRHNTESMSKGNRPDLLTKTFGRTFAPLSNFLIPKTMMKTKSRWDSARIMELLICPNYLGLIFGECLAPLSLSRPQNSL